jgi:hemerythrin superfamily protein
VTELWHVVQADHDLVWSLLNQLTGGPEERRGTPRDHRRTARRLVAVEASHEAAEELVLWPAVRRLCPDGDDLVAEAEQQEVEAKRALNELAHISGGTEEFDETAHALAGMARVHLTYEQNQIWPRLDDRLSDRDADRLVEQWCFARRTGPSRPHPHLPPRAGMWGSIGMAFARMDRVRDRLTGVKPPVPPGPTTGGPRQADGG